MEGWVLIVFVVFIHPQQVPCCDYLVALGGRPRCADSLRQIALHAHSSQRAYAQPVTAGSHAKKDPSVCISADIAPRWPVLKLTMR